MEGSDEQLVSIAAASGDTKAFEELVRRHQTRIRSWLLHLTNNSAQADDLAQDTFLRAWNRLGSFQGRGKFSSWLMKIAYNNFLQSKRQQARDQRLTESLAPEAAERVRVEQDPTLLDLPKLMAVLSDDERVAMTLCYAHGCSHSEIAEVTSMPLGTIKSHIRRGKKKIHEHFDLGAEND